MSVVRSSCDLDARAARRREMFHAGATSGKSQLAAAYAAEVMGADADLLVWVDAVSPGAVISSYAKAAARVHAPGTTGQLTDVEAAARAFLDWAATTKRSWLMVLDDITDPAQIAGWWPASHTGTGWVLATTRRRDADLAGNGRLLVDVDVYTLDEAHTYLVQRCGRTITMPTPICPLSSGPTPLSS